MSELHQYKCPCCDGAIEFNTDSQKMKCPYCDTEFDVDTLKSYEEDLNTASSDNMSWDISEGNSWQDEETQGLRVYQCNSCGGEIICDDTTAATSCPYCSNPVVMKGQLSGDLKPDFVIPFKLDKEAAKAALKKHYGKKRLLPRAFIAQNHIEEIKGVYVPVWLFNATADANIRYRATRVHSWSDSNYYYTETSYYSLLRGGNIAFERVPVDGSEKMNNDLMESIEPFDFSEAVDFKTAYLSGFLADRYDVDSSQSIIRANERIKNSTERRFGATVLGYSSVIPVASGINLRDQEAKYALYPVWLLTTSWNGKNFYFAMNGQTGKFAGDLPLDKKAYVKWLLGITAVASACAFLISYLFWLF